MRKSAYKNLRLVRKLSNKFVSLDVKIGGEIRFMRSCFEMFMKASDHYEVIGGLVLFYASVERVLSGIIKFVLKRDNWIIKEDSLFEKLNLIVDYLNAKGIPFIVDQNIFSRFSQLRNRFHHSCELPRSIEGIKNVSRKVYEIINDLLDLIRKVS